MWEGIVIGVISGALYGATGYLKTQGEKFDVLKFGASAIIGAVIGASMLLAGNPITEQAVETQMAAYAGLTALVYNVLKAIARRV